MKRYAGFYDSGRESKEFKAAEEQYLLNNPRYPSREDVPSLLKESAFIDGFLKGIQWERLRVSKDFETEGD